MPDGVSLPSLTLPRLERGSRETPCDLSFLLYEGGANLNRRDVHKMIVAGQLGKAVRGRIELVTKIHNAIDAKLAAGGSVFSAESQIRSIRAMFRWAEQDGRSLEVETAQRIYLDWSDFLVHRNQIIKEISERSAYMIAALAGYIFDDALERSTPLISTTRLSMPPQRKTARGISAEKQNLAASFEFGSFLQDICDTLTVDTVLKSPLPVRIPLRRGGEIVEVSGYPNAQAMSEKRADNSTHIKFLHGFLRYESEGTLKTRSPLANLRCEAELLMFMGQTGMNFVQACNLKLRQFHFASFIDGYIVRDRKARRGGDVIFEVFKEYKPHFERYLDWRRLLFRDSDALFPFVRSGGAVVKTPHQFRLRDICKKLCLQFIPPQALRNTRINWLLRRSGDVGLTVEMAQHSRETLLRTYERPSQQRAMIEVTHFWTKHDPTIARTTSPAPGECDGKPVPLSALPKNVSEPDCIRPSGCLWCEHHRDIDSLDYVWALTSFRHLKIIEASKWAPPKRSREVHPAQHAIDRISEKLRWFRESNAMRKEWVEESLSRIDEGNYHPQWKRVISALEGSL